MLLFLGIFVVIVLRLVNVQVLKHDDYLYKAEKQQYKQKEVKATRGLIYDCNGELLVYNKNEVSFFVDVRMCNQKKRDTIASRFSNALGISRNELLKIMNEANGNVCIAKKVPYDKALDLENLTIDGLFFEEKPARVYPYEHFASHILGYVNNDYEGVDGIEKVNQKDLKGKDGQLFFERDVRGRLVTVQNDLSVKPIDGSDIYLTINKSYQQILEDEVYKGLKQFTAEYAVGIIMNPNTGEILAMTSQPDYDPNNYGDFGEAERRNRAVADLYDPGSTFKCITMSSFINQKLVKDNERIDCGSPLIVAGKEITDDHKLGMLTPKEIIQHSSNKGMSKLSTRIDKEMFYKYIRDFGFGNTTSLGLPSEIKGVVLHPDKIDNLTKMKMAYGYSISITPIQLASAYCALVNGGTLYQPQIIKKVYNKANGQMLENTPKFIRKVINDATSKKIREYMKSVVDEGTARVAFADFKIVPVGGKTGTAQIVQSGKYTSEKHNSSFAGFIPYDNPQLVCLILVNQPKGGYAGGTVAAPIFKNVMKRIVQLNINLVPEQNRKYITQLSTETANTSKKDTISKNSAKPKMAKSKKITKKA